MNGLIKGKEVHFDEDCLHVKLQDDRIISTPLNWYEPLKKATIDQLKDYRFICANSGIEWQLFWQIQGLPSLKRLCSLAL